MLPITTFAEANKALERYWPQRLQRHVRSREYMEQLMSFLGNPQNTLKVVHVAGTSGKTSTCYYTAALLHAAGAKVGLTTSPFVTEVNERVQLNMAPLPEATFCRALSQFLSLIEASGLAPNYFEVLTAFAFWEFARNDVDYVVMETGMGGLLDPTNVVTRADKVCVIADIGFDHMHVLGNTLSEIAAHKAGIIQLHNAVFCHRLSPEILRVIREQCRQKQADLHTLDEAHAPIDDSTLPLFQQRNFALAYAAAKYIAERDKLSLTKTALTRAAQTYIPGRMEILKVHGKIVVLDAAHNPQKMQALAASMRHKFGDAPIAALVSFSPGLTRATNQLRFLAPVAEHVLLTQFGDQASPFLSMRRDDLLAAAKSARLASYEYQENIDDGVRALLRRPEPVLLITGSLFLLARAQKRLVQMQRAQQ